MTAREYFDQVLLVESDLRRARERLDAAEERADGLGSCGPRSMGRGGSLGDGLLGRVIELDGSRERYARALDGLCEREDEALAVIAAVRTDNAASSARWRECLQYRFVSGMTLSEVAEAVGISVSGVRYAIDSAMDWIDANGVIDAVLSSCRTVANCRKLSQTDND